MISIVIPAFRHAHYIPQTISSVLFQSVPEIELIIINDGSPDETADAVAPFVADSRITYLEQENQGQAAARNRGLSLARGEYVKFLDDDDLLPLGALEWAISYLETHPEVSAVIGGVQYIDGIGNPVGQLQSGQGMISLEDVLTASYPMASPGQTTFRTEALKKIGGFDTHLRNVDDFDLMCRFARREKAAFENRLALNYRWHGSNASSDPSAMYDRARQIVERYLPSVDIRSRSRVRSLSIAKIERNYIIPFLFLGIDSYLQLPSLINSLISYVSNADNDLFGSWIWWKALAKRTWHTLKKLNQK